MADFGLPQAQLCLDVCEELKVFRYLFVASLTTLVVAPEAALGWVGTGGSLSLKTEGVGLQGGLLGPEEELRNKDREKYCHESEGVCLKSCIFVPQN